MNFYQMSLCMLYKTNPLADIFNVIHYSYIFSDMLLHTLLSVLAVSESEVRGYDLYVLETVYVTLTLTHPHRGHLDIQLVSPHGTISVIGAARRKDKYAQLLT